MSDPAVNHDEPQTLSVEDIIKLRKATEPTSLVVLSETAASNFEEEIARKNQELKERVANDIILFLGRSLAVTLALTLALATVDAIYIVFEFIQPAERLITENVVMAVIGATVVQVGVASIAIVHSLFGQPKIDQIE